MLGRLGRLSQLPRRRRLQLLLLLLSMLLCATLLVEDVTWRLRSASMLVWGRYHEKVSCCAYRYVCLSVQ